MGIEEPTFDFAGKADGLGPRIMGFAGRSCIRFFPPKNDATLLILVVKLLEQIFSKHPKAYRFQDISRMFSPIWWFDIFYMIVIRHKAFPDLDVKPLNLWISSDESDGEMFHCEDAWTVAFTVVLSGSWHCFGGWWFASLWWCGALAWASSLKGFLLGYGIFGLSLMGVAVCNITLTPCNPQRKIGWKK